VRAPFDLRGEFARSRQGSGYWIEPAYRLSQLRVWEGLFRRVQLVGRAQQFFVGALPNASLLPANLREGDLGLNYYVRDNFRFTSSFGRQFSSAGNQNVWTLGLTYRFVTALGPRETPAEKN